MQHQVHALSVFDRISFKYSVLAFCPSDRLDTKAGQLSTSSSGHCPVEFLLQYNNNTNLAFQYQKHIVGPLNW